MIIIQLKRNLCSVAVLLIFGSPQLFGQTRNGRTFSGWEIDKPVVYQASQLTKGRFAPDSAKADAERDGYWSTPVVREHPYGDTGGITISDVLPAGRYRASFEVNAKEYLLGDLFAAADVNAAKKMSFRSRVTPVDFSQKGFVTHSVEFYVPPGSVKNVELNMRWVAPINASGFQLKSVTVTRITGAQFLGNMEASKILYRPGENGTIRVSVVNGDTRKSQFKVVLYEETLLDQRTKLHSQDITVQAFESLPIDLPFVAGTQQFGRAFWVELQKDGVLIDQACDVASVSDHLWYVSMGAYQEGILHSTGRYQDSQIAQWVQTACADYANWMEKSFWAPDDWGNLTPTQDEWLSGQAYRYENKERLKKLIAAAHQKGIVAVTYGKGVSGGPAGLEFARVHPDWFISDRFNLPLGRAFDVWDVDHWDDIRFHLQHSKEFKTAWFYVRPDLRRIEILDHGIDELIGSSQQFGWDGVRFDGHFSAGNDELSTWNMQRLKQRLLQANPKYLFGFNIGSPMQYAGSIPHEIQEAAAGGGHWMNEGIGIWSQTGTGNVYSSWRRFADQESRSAEIVRRLGGTYQFIYGLYNHTAVQGLYKFAIGTAAGAHPVYGDQRLAAGCKNWGSFLTRWSCLFWHPDLRLLAADECLLKANSNTPVWDWMANELVLDRSRRLVITHLFNPPTADEIQAKTVPTIEPVTDLKIELRMRPGEKLNGLYFVRPAGLDAIKLETQNVDSIQLPALHSWGMVVADLSGKYVPMPQMPSMLAAPDPKGVAAGREGQGTISSSDPLHPDNDRNAQSSFWFVEAEDVTRSSVQTPRKDPQASAGMAASYDSEMKSGAASSAFYDVLPGKYKASARIKTLNPSPENRILFHAYGNPPKDHPRESLKAVDFADQYREVSLPLSYYSGQYINIIAQGGIIGKDEVVLVDWFRLDLEERYTDSKLVDALQLKPSVVSQSGPASKILILKGLNHELLHVEEALKQIWTAPEITSLYERDQPEKQSLSEFGTLVLLNYPLPSLEMRSDIREWVQSGGHLVVFGGRYTLTEGKWQMTFLEDLLPAKLKDAPDLIALPDGSLLRDGSKSLKGRMAVYWAHDLTPLPDAKIVWWAGKQPVLLQRTIGKGRVTLFAGTVLGQQKGLGVPFWQAKEWIEELSNTLR